MLSALGIRSFKGYASVAEVPIAPFTVLIGANGAGKSSVLQAIDLLGGLVRGTLSEFLSKRGWVYRELPHFLSDKAKFEVSATLDHELRWDLELGIRLRPGIAAERVSEEGRVWLEREGRNMTRHAASGEQSIRQTLTSSWLATVDPDSDEAEMPQLVRVARWARGIRSYLFAPEALRKGGAGEPEDIGETGSGLAPYLWRVQSRDPDRFTKIVDRVRSKIPRLTGVRAKRERGLAILEITERWGNKEVTLSAQQVSDGLLRLLAVSALHPAVADGPSLLLLDEIENGMHPHLLGAFMEMLQDLVTASGGQVQVIATTHSPIALNFVRDPMGVLLVHRQPGGAAKIDPLPKLPGYGRLAPSFDLGELWYNAGEETLLQRG